VEISVTNKPPIVMILDDEEIVRRSLQKRLEFTGYQVLTAASYQEFTEKMVDCDAVLCDIILPDSSGLVALKWTRDHYPNAPVILMTGNPSYETAAEAIRLGAFDYLAKPTSKTELLLTVEQAVEHRRLVQEKERLKAENEAYRRQLEQKVTEKTQALRESQEFLSTLTNTMADAVFSLKMPGYVIEYVNHAATEIFGYQPQEFYGKPFSFLFTDDINFGVFNQKQAATLAAGIAEMRIEQPMLTRDGSTLTTEVVSTFIHAGNGQLSQVISVVRDVTQRSFLFGIVAHEMRSPLSLVTGFVNVLLSDIENMDRGSLAKYLTIINKQTSRMLHMIDEFLDVTKIEFGEVSLNLEPVNIVELLQDYAGDFSYLAGKKNITLTEDYAGPMIECRCDTNKIGEVIANLIDNAIKYSTPGTAIRIIGKKEPEVVWVGIKDEGPGIKSNEIQHLFKGFSHKRISTRPTGGEQSTGLGLAICKRIVEAHRGDIGVNSTPGKGTLFWFSLPVNPEPAKKRLEPSGSSL